MFNQTALEAKRYGVFSCENCRTLGDAIRVMVSEDISALVIMDPEGYLIGLISRTDIIRAAIEHEEDWMHQAVADYMSRDVITVPPEATLHEVGMLLRERRIHRVVVTLDEEGKKKPLSVISDADLVYHLSKSI